MKKILCLICLGFLIFATPLMAANPDPADGLIQIAILLDTSNSMDGLIGQAKSEIWRIINVLAKSRQNGKIPRLEVALFEYGNNAIPAPEGYLRLVVPLTADLDRFSEELFKLCTYGGDEYCGQVIRTAVDSLNWSNGPRDYRMMVIAGNEPFTQGGVDYRQSCRTAVQKGIYVNTIFCGPYPEGIQTNWKDGADRGEGFYLNIDQNLKPPVVRTPQDDELLRLGRELNDTYLPYGTDGACKQKMQLDQDSNAASVSLESAVERQLAKASPVYTNTDWDLVDAVEQNGLTWLDSLPDDELPATLRPLTKEERRQYVGQKNTARQKIQTRIAQLNQERTAYLEQAVRQQSGQSTFGTALIDAIQRQTVKKGFSF